MNLNINSFFNLKGNMVFFSKVYIKIMLSGEKNADDIYNFWLKNPKICEKNKNYICKKILISSGYKNFLNKNYYLTLKELLRIKKRTRSICESSYNISMTQTLWNFCNEYGSCELRNFLIINKPLGIINYRYDIYEPMTYRSLYSEIYSKIENV